MAPKAKFRPRAKAKAKGGAKAKAAPMRRRPAAAGVIGILRRPAAANPPNMVTPWKAGGTVPLSGTGRAGHFAEGGRHQGRVLRARSRGGRRGDEVGDGGRRVAHPAEGDGHSVGCHPESSYPRSIRVSSSSVPPGLRPGGDRGELCPRRQCEADHKGRGRARLEPEPGRGSAGSPRERRVGRAQEETRAAGRSKTRRKQRERRGVRREGQQEEEKEEEKKEGEGGGWASVGWLSTLESIVQGRGFPVRRHGNGPQRKSEEKGSEACEGPYRAEGQEEGGHFQFGDLKWKHGDQRLSPGTRRTVLRDLEGKVDKREVSRSPLRRGFESHARDLAPGDWGRQHPPSAQAGVPHVLQATLGAQALRPDGAGATQYLLSAGCPGEEQAKSLCRHSSTKTEECRSYVGRNTLECVTEDGGADVRGRLVGREIGGGESLQGEPAGAKDQEAGISPTGAMEERGGSKRRKGPEGAERRQGTLRQRQTRPREQRRERSEECRKRREEGLSSGVFTLGEEEKGDLKEDGFGALRKGDYESFVGGSASDCVGTPAAPHSGAFEWPEASYIHNRYSLPHQASSGGVEVFSIKVQDGSPRQSGEKVSELGARVLQCILEVFPLRSQSMGGGDGKLLFPLPTSRDTLALVCPSVSGCELNWLLCVCVGLNSFWGGPLFFDGVPNEVQRKCLPLLGNDVRRFCDCGVTVEDFDWDSFFSTRSVDYQGDEVKVAKAFTWENIAGALPAEIGRVPLAEVCSLGAKRYVENFSAYLKPRELWTHCKAPKVMVADRDWGFVCQGLVSTGVCVFLKREEVFTTDQGLLLNGLFGVSKEEFKNGVEIFRLIMNLIPLNNLAEPMAGDIQTLPTWSLMNPFYIQPRENLLISSEDVRCFFYTMSVPEDWWQYLAFNKVVPDEALPDTLKGEEVYLASRVLPMGFLNSVSLAQHVHRNLALTSSLAGGGSANPPESELRKDRCFPEASTSWRIYLDNYDLLERVDKVLAPSMEGTVAAGVMALRQQYEVWDVPRNLKKAVSRSFQAEVQGAMVDGELGVAYPKPDKLSKYLAATLKLLSQTHVSQRQMQVVCGGLAYMTMFRRPLLGCLNEVWRFIESFKSGIQKFKVLPELCRLELIRFVGLFPLARLDFRLGMHEQVTCSDASTSGGGVCCSTGLTARGALVAEGELRGERPERSDIQVLSIGLFDGIGALRVALDLLRLQCICHTLVSKRKIRRPEWLKRPSRHRSGK